MAKKKDPHAPKDKERFEILLEDIQDKVQLLADGQKMQGERLEAKMEEGFKAQDLKGELATKALIKRIDGVEESLTKRIDGVEESLTKKIGENTKEIRELNTEIREKVMLRLEDHEQRITTLEKKPAA